jgi:hypothetical protein
MSLENKGRVLNAGHPKSGQLLGCPYEKLGGFLSRKKNHF